MQFAKCYKNDTKKLRVTQIFGQKLTQYMIALILVVLLWAKFFSTFCRNIRYCLTNIWYNKANSNNNGLSIPVQ